VTLNPFSQLTEGQHLGTHLCLKIKPHFAPPPMNGNAQKPLRAAIRAPVQPNHPQFLRDVFGGALSEDARGSYLDHTDIKVTDVHFSAFSGAIIEFWHDVPENVFQSQITGAPNWLSKAMKKEAK
jgi:hypothetical protein